MSFRPRPRRPAPPAPPAGPAARPAGGSAPLTCPRDGARLDRVEAEGAEVDRCPTCAGLWVPADAVEPLAARVAPAVAAPAAWEAVRYARCPACRGPMDRRNYRRVSGVLVDACPAHGVWLDAGELERIGAFLSTGGAERAAAHERRLEEERRETAKVLAHREKRARQAASPYRGDHLHADEMAELLDAVRAVWRWLD